MSISLVRGWFSFAC